MQKDLDCSDKPFTFASAFRVEPVGKEKEFFEILIYRDKKVVQEDRSVMCMSHFREGLKTNRQLTIEKGGDLNTIRIERPREELKIPFRRNISQDILQCRV